MIDALIDCAAWLRRAGVEVPLSATVDATEALGVVDLTSRDEVRVALAATLVKRPEDLEVFSVAFDRCFPARGSVSGSGSGPGPGSGSGPGPGSGSGPGPGSGSGPPPVLDDVASALADRDEAALAALAHRLVGRYGGLESVASVRHSERYHVQRVERAVDLSGAFQQALRADRAGGGRRSELDEHLARAEISATLKRLRRELRREVMRRLPSEDDVRAGVVPVGIEDIDFVRASNSELRAMRAAVRPLARRLAARLATRDRNSNRTGRVDIRRTVRRSLSTGGVPLQVATRRRARTRPELWLLCDVSGSMAEFARFALGFVYAMQEEFARTRTFVFVDDVEEVTASLAHRSHDLDPYALLIQASDVHGRRRSDYGRAFGRFWDTFGGEAGPRATVIVTGDARTHDLDPGVDTLRLVAARARRVWFLNPEPRPVWDVGDSVASLYGDICDHMAEVRNLRQLAACLLSLA